MKIYIITKGEDYEIGDIIGAFLYKEQAVIKAKEMADEENLRRKKYCKQHDINPKFYEYFYKQQNDGDWYNGLGYIDICESEILDYKN